MFEQTASRSNRERLASVVGVVAQRQSYRNILYLVLAFVLTQVYMILLVFAVVGSVFTIVGIGVVVLFGALVGSRLLAEFERQLANALLGTDIKQPPAVETGEGAWRTAVAYATDHATWRGIGFLALKFWLGIVSFVIVFVGFVLVLALLLPVGEAEVFGWTIDSTAESLAAIPVGVVLLFAFFHLCNAVASLSGTAATALLGPGTEGRPDTTRRSGAGPGDTRVSQDPDTRVTSESGKDTREESKPRTAAGSGSESRAERGGG